MDEIKRQFFEMKGDRADRYRYSHSFNSPSGKLVAVFREQWRDRQVQVYLSEKGYLMPYFERQP